MYNCIYKIKRQERRKDKNKNVSPDRKPICSIYVVQIVKLHLSPFQHLIRSLNLESFIVLFREVKVFTVYFQGRVWFQLHRTLSVPSRIKRHCHALDCS